MLTNEVRHVVPPRGTLRCLVVIGMLLALVGCAEASSSPRSSIASPSMPPNAGAANCTRGELLAPDGSVLNLTGAWRTQVVIWLITQTGSCVAVEVLSEFPDEEYGSRLRAVMSGDLRPDFTITGRATVTFSRGPAVYYLRGVVSELTLGVEFSDDGSPILRLPDSDGGAGETLERFSVSTQIPPVP